MRLILTAGLAWLAIACRPQLPHLGTAEAPLVVGYVLPNPSPAGLPIDQEFAQTLVERSGWAVELRPFRTSRELVEDIGAGEVHVAWLDPLAYLWAHQRYGVEVALVSTREGSPTQQGQIIAHADYGIISLADLKGVDFCWLEPPTLSAVIMPRVFLTANGLDPERDLGEPRRFNSEGELVQAVYAGECQVGATSVDARKAVLSQFPDVWDKVRVIAETAPIPHQVLGFSAEVPAAVRERLAAVLLGVVREPGVREALGLEGLLPARDDLFDELRTQLSAAGIEIESLMESPLHSSASVRS